LLLAPRPARASIAEDQAWLSSNIMCLCGMGNVGCRHVLRDCGAECGEAPMERAKIAEMLAAGKTRADIIQYYIEKYGSQAALASPIDKGFNRLAWLLPYTVGAAGVGALGLAAWRFTKRRGAASPAAQPGEPKPAVDPDLEDRLDDELRNLD
jgi:hypothetical protein